jgi:3-deoxy-D-manno-octulosonic-acid transferase
MRPVYRFTLSLYNALLAVAALWNTKARLIRKGRKQAWFQLTRLDPDMPVIWFHCASLGEFEMGRPVMEGFLDRNPHWQLLVTFYSPSGYEFRKNYARATAVCYLPADKPANARKLMARARPQQAVFVKYDLWYYYISALQKQQVPVALISATFRPTHRYFRNAFFRNMLQGLSQIFVQDTASSELLTQAGIPSVVAGDTRCDRVLDLAAQATVPDAIAQFIANRRVLVAGSCWAEEEKLLQQAWPEPADMCLILAPHDVSPGHVASIMRRWPNHAVRLSEYSGQPASVLVIDSIGLLASVYKTASLALVGGGFSGYLHNVLEPAAHGKAVAFGPKHQRFHEAQALIDSHAARTVSTTEHLRALFSDAPALQSMGQNALQYVQQSRGATHIIVEAISPKHVPHPLLEE